MRSTARARLLSPGLPHGHALLHELGQLDHDFSPNRALVEGYELFDLIGREIGIVNRDNRLLELGKGTLHFLGADTGEFIPNRGWNFAIWFFQAANDLRSQEVDHSVHIREHARILEQCFNIGALFRIHCRDAVRLRHGHQQDDGNHPTAVANDPDHDPYSADLARLKRLLVRQRATPVSPQRYPPLCFKNLNNQNEPSAKRAIISRGQGGHPDRGPERDPNAYVPWSSPAKGRFRNPQPPLSLGCEK